MGGEEVLIASNEPEGDLKCKPATSSNGDLRRAGDEECIVRLLKWEEGSVRRLLRDSDFCVDKRCPRARKERWEGKERGSGGWKGHDWNA